MPAVLLRDVTEDDLPIFFEQQSDPIANLLAAFPARDWEAFAPHWEKILNDASVHKQTILFDGQVAGNVLSFERFGKREVGYWLGREHWGQGVATQALAEFLLRVKSRPLYARVAKHNYASIRVLEKCGFTIAAEDGGSPSADGIEEVLLKLD